MLCFRYKKLLIPYSEGALDNRVREKVGQHISVCKRCAADLAAIRSVSCALRSVDAPAMEPASDLWAKVSGRIAEEQVARALMPWNRVFALASACLATAVVASIGIGFMRGVPNPPQKHTRHTVAQKSEPIKTDNSFAEAQWPKLNSMPPEEKVKTPTEAPKLSVKTAYAPPAAPGHMAALRSHNMEGRKQKIAKREPIVVALYTRARSSSSGAYGVRRGNQPDLMPADKEDFNKAEVTTSSDHLGMGYPVATIGSPVPRAAAEPSAVDAAVSMGLSSDADFKDRADKSKPVSNDESVVDSLNETEGVRMAAMFSYP